MRRMALLGAAGLLTSLTAGSRSALGATATVTGDAGTAAALSTTVPTAIRNIDVDAEVTFGTTEQGLSFTSTVLDPTGTPVSYTATCLGTKFSPSWKHSVEYRGNGTYTLWVRYYVSADTACATPVSEQRFPFTISASTTVTAPTTPILLREPNSFSKATPEIPVALNPGATTYEVRYGAGAVLAADGSISGPSDESFVDRSKGTASLFLKEPGTYTVVARVKSGSYASPWSAPATLTVLGPFDLDGLDFPDSRGPRYTIKVKVREKTATGIVSAALAPGEKGGKFVSIGKAKLRGGVTPNASFTFTRKKIGIYRLKLTYPGSATVAAGFVITKIRITRTLSFG